MAVVSLQAVVAHAPPARCFQRRRLSVVAMAGSSPPPSEPKKPKKPSGPGNAPLRMQTDEQRKLGYGGDDSGGGRGGGGGDGWEPGGNDDGANPIGLAVLVGCGLWAYWEWRRPGGKLNPNTKYQYAR